MLLLLVIVLVGVVVFAVAAFAVGWLPGMSDAPPDAGDTHLPPGRIRAADVAPLRFGLAFRGYRIGEVDEVLDRMRDDLTAYEAELHALRGDEGGPGKHAARRDDVDAAPEPQPAADDG